jgi:hypothetical protein
MVAAARRTLREFGDDALTDRPAPMLPHCSTIRVPAQSAAWSAAVPWRPGRRCRTRIRKASGSDHGRSTCLPPFVFQRSTRLALGQGMPSCSWMLSDPTLSSDCSQVRCGQW